MAHKTKKKKQKKVPKGMHMMPNGYMMKDSEMKKMMKRLEMKYK